MLLGSGVIQVGTRSPVTIAQTAMTLAHISGGRFLLGLGVSGPQVLEGLHGIPFARPLARMRETVQIVRSVLAGEKVSFQGSHYRIPLPGGDGRPMRVSLPPVPVPVYLATLSPKMLELTGEIADGWLVRTRLKTWRDTGVDTLRLYPAGDTLAARLDNLARGIDLVRALGPG